MIMIVRGNSRVEKGSIATAYLTICSLNPSFYFEPIKIASLELFGKLSLAGLNFINYLILTRFKNFQKENLSLFMNIFFFKCIS